MSMLNHMQNIHDGHDGEIFTACAHPEINAEEQKKWLKPGKLSFSLKF